MLSRITELPSTVFEYVIWILTKLAKFSKTKEHKMNVQLRHLIIQLAHIGLTKDFKQSVIFSIKALRHLADAFECDIPLIATRDAVRLGVELLSSSDTNHIYAALNFLSCLFVSEDGQIIEYAFSENLLDRLNNIFEAH